MSRLPHQLCQTQLYQEIPLPTAGAHAQPPNKAATGSSLPASPASFDRALTIFPHKKMGLSRQAPPVPPTRRHVPLSFLVLSQSSLIALNNIMSLSL